MKVVVIGAGILGSGLAWRLARHGLECTLVERDSPASGTTGSSLSYFNAAGKRPEDYYRLNLAGVDAYYSLRDELGEAPWMNESGTLVASPIGEWRDVPATTESIQARLDELAEWNYPARWLTREEAQELEPNIRFADDIVQFAFFSKEGWVDAPLLTRSMARMAGEEGATLKFGSEVTAIEQQAGRISGVVLASGERISCDLVVNCAGPWSDQIAAMVGRTLPLVGTTGFITRVSGVPADAIRRVVYVPGIHFRPDGEELFVLHSYDSDRGVGVGDSPDEWADQLIERFKRYVPAAAGARLARWTVATRPVPGDKRTSAGLVKSIPGYAEIVSHSAVTMGVVLPKLVADEITSGEVSPLLANFSPDRFSDAAGS